MVICSDRCADPNCLRQSELGGPLWGFTLLPRRIVGNSTELVR